MGLQIVVVVEIVLVVGIGIVCEITQVAFGLEIVVVLLAQIEQT